MEYEGGIDFNLTNEEKEFCKNATIENVKSINIHKDTKQDVYDLPLKELTIKVMRA